ncbi:MAG: hypothetical protein HYU43_03110 [Armatimonadetes bacterium]|nr:hypothetical protein [Armatimonadota bacterium]
MRLHFARHIGLSIGLGAAWLLVGFLIPSTRAYVVFWGPLVAFSLALQPAALMLGEAASCAGFDRWACPPLVDVTLWLLAGSVVLFVLYLMGLLTFTVARAFR